MAGFCYKRYMSRIIFITAIVFCVSVGGMAFAAAISKFKQKTEMDFATIIADPTGDVINLRPNSRITAKRNSILVGTPQSGKFTARGDANAAVSISFSAGDVLSGPGQAIPLTDLRHNKGTTPAFNANGRITIKVGAKLRVNAGQVAGAYAGTYMVFLEYQ